MNKEQLIQYFNENNFYSKDITNIDYINSLPYFEDIPIPLIEKQLYIAPINSDFKLINLNSKILQIIKETCPTNFKLFEHTDVGLKTASLEYSSEFNIDGISFLMPIPELKKLKQKLKKTKLEELIIVRILPSPEIIEAVTKNHEFSVKEIPKNYLVKYYIS